MIFLANRVTVTLLQNNFNKKKVYWDTWKIVEFWLTDVHVYKFQVSSLENASLYSNQIIILIFPTKKWISCNSFSLLFFLNRIITIFSLSRFQLLKLRSPCSSCWSRTVNILLTKEDNNITWAQKAFSPFEIIFCGFFEQMIWKSSKY